LAHNLICTSVLDSRILENAKFDLSNLFKSMIGDTDDAGDLDAVPYSFGFEANLASFIGVGGVPGRT
jgi:hypothetical protein